MPNKGKAKHHPIFDKKDDRWCTPQYRIQTADRNVKHLWDLDQQKNVSGYNPNIVLLGASIIDSLSVIPTAKDTFSEYIDTSRVVNFGGIGDELGHIIWRLEDASLSEIFRRMYEPKLVILLAGENDIHKAPIESMMRGIKRIINKIFNDWPNAKVVVIGLPPQLNNSSPLSNEELNDKISKYNKKLSYLSGISSYYYCWNEMFNDNKIESSYLTSDVYLTLKGNIILIQKIAEIVYGQSTDDKPIDMARPKAVEITKKTSAREKASYEDDDY
jgi:hypothetical protein